MDENLNATINKIVQLTRQNAEFDTELRKALGLTSSANFGTNNTISNDVYAIRSALEIRANASISYNFIKEQRVRDQLIIDNLRMENSALNLNENEDSRFYSFCVNAFYQIENTLNYFYYKNFYNIDAILENIEDKTIIENKYCFKRKGFEKDVRDISINDKINAFCNTYFPGDKLLKINCSNLRKVRNEGEHRCMIIKSTNDGNEPLRNFIKYNTINSIRNLLSKIVTSVKENLHNII
jgi:hypothetical protein